MENEVLVNGGYPLHTFQDLEDIYRDYISNPEDRALIKKAYDFILEKHNGQLRKSGEPYYHHLLEVAYLLAAMHAGPATICAGLLHDVVEDTDTTIEDIREGWGEEVSQLVDSLTKIQRLKLSKITAAEFEAEDHRKILIGMAKDIRVILIKLCDRLHNMRTLDALSPERQVSMSKETMDVFVPIASRLGLDHIMSEMADLCLKHLEPERYEEVAKLLAKKTKVLNKSLDAFKKRIADLLFEKGIPFEISSRVKSIHSIYNKIYGKGHTFDEIYDILALRIITDTEMECYEILGIIHKAYIPVPGRFKDYIAMPKPNMYQSLHTTVVSGDGNFYEIQIRTKEMDDIAESGVAAHWAYKEGSGYNSRKEQEEIENKLHWFRDFVSMSNDSNADNASDYVDSLTHDIFEANVYVFTPKGKVVELLAGATPVDFAYRIHTKVGESTVGALVNGVMVPLNTVLKTGDMVEIKTSKKEGQGPSEGWLEFVKTNLAKNQIKKYLAKKNADLMRDDDIAKGKYACIDAFKDRGIDEDEMMKIFNEQQVWEKFSFSNLDDLFVAVSNRNPTSAAIIETLKIKKKAVFPNNFKTRKAIPGECPVYCKGADKIAIQLASCCTPIPGDDIIGYITRGKGITVHRKTCPNIQHESERLIEVFWKEDIEFATFPVDLIVEATDRNNLLVDIMNTMNNSKVVISNLHAQLSKNEYKTCTIALTLMVSDAKRLGDITNIILNIKGVYRVNRIIH